MAASLSVKIYYVEHKVTKEIRKFSIDAEVAESYEYLVSNIRQVFPSLQTTELKLFWKDDEDDYISISSDDELQQALQSMPSSQSCLKIFVKAVHKNKEHFNEHPGITCDGCNSQINGIRYKCTVCFDYDLCSSCALKGQHPDDHELLCIKKPRLNNSIYVMRSPFNSGCFRGNGPWCHSGRGKWGLNKKYGCPRKNQCCSSTSKDKSQKTDDTTDEKLDHPIVKMISEIATSFGLDPNVAISQAHNIESVEEVFSNFAECFNLNSDQLKEAKGFFPHNETVDIATKSKEEEEEKESIKKACGADDKISPLPEKMETMNIDAKPEAEINLENNHEKVAAEIAKQFGFDPQLFQQSVQANGEKPSFGNFGEIMGKIFQNFATPVARPNDICKEKENVKTKEDFVVVGSSSVPEHLSKEKKYEQRLDEAIKQMETMGFKEDNGWLRQLLISKDLSIEKVLDALNPSK